MRPTCRPHLGGNAAVQTLVQSAWSEEGWVDQVWPTGGSQYIHSLQAFHAIQLGEQLVDHAIRDARAVVATAWGERVELVEEQDARLGGLCSAGHKFKLGSSFARLGPGKMRTHCGGNIASCDVARPWQNAATLFRAAWTQEMLLELFRTIFCVQDTKFVSATNVARVSKRINI